VEPDQAAVVLREALAERTGDWTIADAAAKGGLALRDAELGLHRLLAVHRGHLSVTEKGELLFRFPGGFAVDWERRGRLQATFRAIGRTLAGLGKWTVRVGLTVFLVGYGVVFALGLFLGAIALSIVAEDGAPLEGFGYLAWGMGELVFDALYWSTHPRASIGGEGAEKHSRRFYERVNRFFFGPPRAPEDPRALTRTLAGEIRLRRGRIGVGDVVRVTGLPRAEAEATLSRLLVDYEGHVDVTEEGAIIYRFPELRPSTERVALPAPGSASGSPAVWHRPVEKPAYTGNPTGSNVAIVALTAFVAVIAWVGTALGLPFGWPSCRCSPRWRSWRCRSSGCRFTMRSSVQLPGRTAAAQCCSSCTRAQWRPAASPKPSSPRRGPPPPVARSPPSG
jgi:hypothetical protein